MPTRNNDPAAFSEYAKHGKLREGGTAKQAETAAPGPVWPTGLAAVWGASGYSQPHWSATRSASVQLRVPLLVVAPDR